MTNEFQMTNDEWRDCVAQADALPLTDACCQGDFLQKFVIRASSFVRHSSFVIRHSPKSRA
jgi:hypothetical protein